MSILTEETMSGILEISNNIYDYSQDFNYEEDCSSGSCRGMDCSSTCFTECTSDCEDECNHSCSDNCYGSCDLTE